VVLENVQGGAYENVVFKNSLIFTPIVMDGGISTLTGFITRSSFLHKFGIAFKIVSYVLMIFGLQQFQ